MELISAPDVDVRIHARRVAELRNRVGHAHEMVAMATEVTHAKRARRADVLKPDESRFQFRPTVDARKRFVVTGRRDGAW